MHARTIVLVMVAACGYPPLDSMGSGGGGGGGPDGGNGGSVCQAPASYGAATVSQQSGDLFASDGEADYQGALNANDVLAVWLFDADPPFSGTFMPGAFDLSGQTDLGSCGTCVLIAAHCNSCDLSNGQGVGSWYIANAGTLQLTTFTPNTIAGTLANATLVHVAIDFTTGAATPAGDGCTAHVASVAFSTPLTQH